jgi:para-aminobenzoate synthetase component 1
MWLELVPEREPAVAVVEPLPPPGVREDGFSAEQLVTLARALAREASYPFWLDSGLDVGGQGRYSFLGAEPAGWFRSRGDENELCWGGRRASWRGDPFDTVRRILARRPLLASEGAPPFVGGAVGYFGYDLRYYIERLPRRGQDDLGLPDCFLGFYDAVLAYDHGTGQLLVCSDTPGSARQMVEFGERLTSPPAPPRSGEGRKNGPDAWEATGDSGSLRGNFTRPAYLRAVRRVLDYIAAGDIYQVNLSQRFSTRFTEEPFALYERLRRQSPAPFAAYLDMGELAILSASPERFLRIAGREVRTRPIKGTRPRGATPAEDERLAAELLASAKDRAELVMIVDLERNDLGRVCEYGSVRVPELIRLETHPTVFHLVATVTGRLRPEVTPVDCLRACFPGGSITGAPKIRAMEIIEELEPTHRGPYTGAIGYLGWDGSCDLNIAIRTLTLAGGEAHFQVGGGIVADSDPDAEYEETLHKGRALMRALGVSL